VDAKTLVQYLCINNQVKNMCPYHCDWSM